ncbi:putative myb-like DNA-binding domain containing protein [Lyophyllum shimeji]|uniref:Myb-like DNA-binding domain containing protein n=1 Tax=Lyophyllum shimeji TaxID=47721 RepID=A0A9P3UJP0_LYOSH|nr:putative myb-like DNA-binding domain containing protein [Lyophyllum shimeji]
MDVDATLDDGVEAKTDVFAQLKGMTEKALHANTAHQYALTKYAEQLTAELQEVEKLMDAVTSEDVDDEPDAEVQIPGATKATGLCPTSEFWNPESPFFEHASRRARYLSYTVDHPMKAKELEALAEAVRGENIRLQAYEAQKSGQDAAATFDIENNTEGINWTTVAERVSNVCTVKRTADQCRIRWLGDRHPRINHGEWSSNELEKLKGLVSTQLEVNNGKVDWVQVAKDLGTHPPRLLAEAVNLYGIDNWSLVARYVSEDATAGQCQGRYARAIDPSRKRGPWSDEEFERLKAAVAAYGNSWVEVAACIPGRTNEQCRERWTEHLSLSSANIVWSEADDQALMDAVNAMGNRWTAISAKLGNKATGHQCRARWEKLKRLREAAVAGPSSIASTSQQGAAPPAAISRPRGRPRKELAVPSTATDESETTPVPTIRPKPRPIGKGKGKEKAIEPPSHLPPSTSATESTSDAASVHAPILDSDGAKSTTNPKKRMVDDTAEEVPTRKRRKEWTEVTGFTHSSIQAPETPHKTSLRKGAKQVGRPRKTASRSTTTASATSASPSLPGEASEATEGTSATNAEETTPPAPRPKPRPRGRPKQVITQPDSEVATEAPSTADAFPELGSNEPGTNSITSSSHIANAEIHAALDGKPKPRQRGRPRKVLSPS